jgi:MerR family copper efflux transcriptional regulator
VGMNDKLTIGQVSRRTGLPVRTIRFYEAEGVIGAPARTVSGYRLYSTTDIRRLRLARRGRLLGLPLSEVKTLVRQAFESECIDFADQVLRSLAGQRSQIDQRIAELQALRTQLEELEEHVQHCQAEARPGQTVVECTFCPIIDEEGGAPDGH